MRGVGSFLRTIIKIKANDTQWLETLPEVKNLCQLAAYIALAEQWIVLLDTEVELSVSLMGSATVRKLNSAYRDLDKPASVLSFSTLDVPIEFLVPNDPVNLGDVVISFENIWYEAIQKAIPFSDYLQCLVMHSILHLIGYEHEQGISMENLEKSTWSRLRLVSSILVSKDISFGF